MHTVDNQLIPGFAFYDDNITLDSKCDWAPGMWKQLELTSKLESDLQDN